MGQVFWMEKKWKKFCDDADQIVEQLEAKNHVYEESSSEQLVMDLCLASDVIVAELVL